MAFPKITDLVTYINRKLTGNDWNTNWQKIVNWLSLGDTDIKVKSVEADSIKYNGTTIVQNGNINTDTITANTVTANSFIGDGSHLENVKVSDVFAYTPFSVNFSKGGTYITTSDNDTKIVFLVDNWDLYQPLVITTAEGKTITLTQINDFDVANSGLVAGDYYIFVDEESDGGTCYLKKCTIYRQLDEPIGNNGDVWFRTMFQPYQVWEKEGGSWWNKRFYKVPIAKVTLAEVNGVMSATNIVQLPFNVNGANVVYDGKYSDETQRPNVVVKTYESSGTWYRIYSDGWVEQGGLTESGASGDRIVNLPIEMKYTNYCITLSAGIGSGSGSTNNTVEDITTTGFKIWTGSPSAYTWRVEGIMK